MFLAFCAVLALAVTPLLGGRLSRLTALRFRWGWVIFAALVVQIWISIIPASGHRTLEAVAHDLTYVGALTVVAVNRRVRGMLVLGAGAFCNGLAIAVNGGTLPASAQAVAQSGFHKQGTGLDNSAVLAHPHLAWLGDRWVTPSWLPFRNVASIGDLFIVAGVAIIVWGACQVFRGWPWARLRRRFPAVRQGQ